MCGWGITSDVESRPARGEFRRIKLTLEVTDKASVAFRKVSRKTRVFLAALERARNAVVEDGAGI